MFYQRYESEFMRFIIYHKIKQDSHDIGLYMINLSVNELTRSVTEAVTESSFWLTVITFSVRVLKGLVHPKLKMMSLITVNVPNP